MLYVEPETIFGEILHFHGTPLHYFSLRFVETSDVICFPLELLHDPDFCRQYPHLILNLIRSISIKAGAFICRASDAIMFQTQTQICRILFHLWKEAGECSSFEPKISQAEIVEILGLNRSSLTRTLRLLRDEGIIGNYFKKNLEIVNPQKLMEFAGIISLDGTE